MSLVYNQWVKQHLWQGWIQGGGANPENQFENGAKFLCLKGKGRTISLFLHQKCFNVNSSGHKEPQNCNNFHAC